MYRKILNITDNPRDLRKKSSVFLGSPDWADDDKSFLQDLQDTFSVMQGLGLAAPQIGIFKRAIVVNLKHLGLSESESEVMINPEIQTSGEVLRSKEACFSVPGVEGFVERPQECIVTYTRLNGESNTIPAKGYAAVCLQHEIDHLDGILYIDRMGPLSRKMILKKVEKSNKRKLEAARLAKQAFDNDHRELQGDRQAKKTTHSKKRKPKPRKSKSNKRKSRKGK